MFSEVDKKVKELNRQIFILREELCEIEDRIDKLRKEIVELYLKIGNLLNG